jgi:serine/threonine protein kinase
VGAGGFGVVLSAFDDELERMVAIKLPHQTWSSRLDFVDNYLTEARVLASLDHSNIVPVYDFGRAADGRPFVVSKFIEGNNLSELLTRGRPDFTVSSTIAAAIAEALHHAHLQTIVHRDVKPANILIDSAGKAYLADFGIVLREQDFGRGPTFAGTPAYMSPEQARSEGHRVDGRSDIFSLGVVLYQLLTGRRPFHADTEDELLRLVIDCDARPPRQIDDTIPRELERICLKAMSKRACDRYSTAKDMADELRLWQVQGCASPAGVPVPTSTPKSDLGESHVTPGVSTPSRGTIDSALLRVVPKGLRSFDAHDADFFLELLPGPRDRDGLPDSLRFWKTRIEVLEHKFAFRITRGSKG